MFGTEPNEFLRDNTGRLQLGAVCCIGDGEGRNGQTERDVREGDLHTGTADVVPCIARKP